MGRKALTVDAANQRLDAAQMGLKLYLRGEKLSLRGTLPPRPDSKETRPKQQFITLGVYANPAGIEYAEAEAFRLGALLAQRRFDWREVEPDTKENSKTCQAWIDRFQQDWQKRQEGNEDAIALRWREQFWYPAFKWLPPTAKLTSHLLDDVVDRWKPNSRSRQVACQKLQRLADFAGIESKVRDGPRGRSLTIAQLALLDIGIPVWAAGIRRSAIDNLFIHPVVARPHLVETGIVILITQNLPSLVELYQLRHIYLSIQALPQLSKIAFEQVKAGVKPFKQRFQKVVGVHRLCISRTNLHKALSRLGTSFPSARIWLSNGQEAKNLIDTLTLMRASCDELFANS